MQKAELSNVAVCSDPLARTVPVPVRGAMSRQEISNALQQTQQMANIVVKVSDTDNAVHDLIDDALYTGCTLQLFGDRLLVV